MTEHNHDCACGGTHDDEDIVITLTLEDDTEADFIVAAVFPVGERDYIALLPAETADSEESEIYLYRFSETPEGEPNLDNIETEAEYEAVADVFDAMLDEQPEA